ncbi:MAG TPA: dihydrodipicolinate synthase family protein [Bryobacteraceae bacterium]|nr:dihydrodipicolinate synthase family protein [Bryobacteraceae bacterium]
MDAVSGVYAAAITPRREGPGIDLAGVFDLLDFLGRGGVDGIALMGSTGEFLHFPVIERCRLISLAVRRSRVPILAGVSHSTLEGALSLAREAASAGAAGVLLMPPYFFSYSQDDVRHFYLHFADALKGAVPIFLYNIPSFTTAISSPLAIELLSTGLFEGIKDSTAGWDDFEALRAARERFPFTLMAGQDVLYSRARLAGADGVISGIASAIPELHVALDRALLAGQTERAEALDRRLQEFVAWIPEFPAPVAIREAAALRGMRPGPPAAPPGPEAKQKLAHFADWFKSWLPVMLEECSQIADR